MSNELGTRFLPGKGWRKEALLETYKSQIQLLLEGLKLLGLANGGAVVAILSLAGATVTKCANVPSITGTVAWFSAGLAAVIIAFFLAYSSQVMFLKYVDTENETNRKLHFFYFVLGLVAVVAGLTLFVLGALEASRGIDGFKCSITETGVPAAVHTSK